VIRCSLQDRPSHPGAGRGWWQITTAYSLWSAVRKLSDFDAAVVLSPPLFLGMAAAHLKVPIILNVQDLFPQSALDLGVLRPGLVASTLQRIERHVYSRAAHITVHSDGNRSYIERTGTPASKITVLPNWIDTDELQPGPRDNAFAREHKLADKFVVTFAGVLGISLGIELVAEAALQLAAYRDIKFLVVGDGAAETTLRERIKTLDIQNVLQLSMQPKSVYPEILAASDVCLVLLRSDVKTPVVPGKINSIMAAGRPIVASVPLDGDAAKLVSAAQAGLITPAGDVQPLADAILRLRSDPSLREQLGKNGRCYAEAHLSLKYALSGVESLLDRVTHGTMK
jgi:glycosyltransferase involved in cell wall biosynthesis